jgi:hypothetical protein
MMGEKKKIAPPHLGIFSSSKGLLGIVSVAVGLFVGLPARAQQELL